MRYGLSVYTIHELGRRANQEDWLSPLQAHGLSSETVFVLCDGMGGHASGEVASRTVCEAISEYVNTHTADGGFYVRTDFQAALDVAYDALDAKDDGSVKKMGTTLVFAKFHEGGCFTAHIGDSRIYHIRPGNRQILHITHDHSLVNELVALGEMTPGEARTSSQRNIITRAMQPSQEHRTPADCFQITDLEPGDYIYLCSDGMLECMEDRELVDILSSRLSDEEKTRALRDATADNRDNHSALLIRLVQR